MMESYRRVLDRLAGARLGHAPRQAAPEHRRPPAASHPRHEARMTARRTHIVGAGIAGLSAALAVTARRRRGRPLRGRAAGRAGAAARFIPPTASSTTTAPTCCSPANRARARSPRRRSAPASAGSSRSPRGCPSIDRPHGRDAPGRPLALVLAAAVAPSARA